MLNTKFSKEEMNQLCQLLKAHGTDCNTLVEILKLANRAAPNDSADSYKHVRLLKEFGVLGDRDLLCHTCIHDAVELHANTCEEHKKRMKDEYFIPCPDDHYHMEKCEVAIWMVDCRKMHNLENEAAYKAWKAGSKNISSWTEERDGREVVMRHFDHTGRTEWLEKTFPDIPSDVRHNPWMGFFCEKHVGSMKPYSNRISGYR